MEKTRKIDEVLVENLVDDAGNSLRRRSIYSFHNSEDVVQRMLNAVEPDSYIQPHKHENPDKIEVFLILKGKGAVVFFDDSGVIIQTEVLDPKGPVFGVDILSGTWHMPIALEAGTVFYEVIQGPYKAETHKKFAAWAPSEEDQKTANEYLCMIKKKI